MKNFFRKKRKYVLSSSLVVGFFVYFFVFSPEYALASDTTFTSVAITALGVLAQLIIYVCGLILTAIVKVILAIAEYNGFISEKPIVEAWTIVRDFCNMFFILILLVIAFATILRVESYNMKKWLPKLIIMAILINFSKMICGILIDASQIVFLSFISVLDNGSGLFTTLGVDSAVSAVVDDGNDLKVESDGFLKSVGAMMGGIVFLIISTIVLLAIAVVLLMRMVMFWIYIVLSPLAFLLSSFPNGQSYAKQYWSEFTRYLVNGPVLAFFVWLSLIAANGTDKITLKKGQSDMVKSILNNSNGTTEIFTGDVLLSYVIAIGMLVGGLMVSSQIGGAAGGVASRGISWAKKGAYFGSGAYLGAAATKWATNKTVSGVKSGGRALGTSTLGLARGIDRNIGKNEGGYFGSQLVGLKNRGTFARYKEKSMDKVATDTALHSFYSKQKAIETNGDLSVSQKKEEIKKLKLSHAGHDYREHNKKFYKVNKDGDFVDKDNEKETISRAELESRGASAKRQSRNRYGKDKTLEAMDERKANMFMGMASAKSGAWAATKMATEEKINKEQKGIAASGMTADMMHQKIKDGSTSDSEKMALALTMAAQGGFNGKTLADVQAAKKTLGSNQLLLKQFDDAIDKRFAHLNYNLKTDEGKAAFQRRFESGKIEDLHESAYKGEHGREVLSVIHKSKGDAGFNNYIEKTAEKSGTYRTAVTEVLKDGFKNFDKDGVINDSGNLNAARVAMYNVTGDLAKTMEGAGSDMTAAVTRFFNNASTKQLANLNQSAFDKAKVSEVLRNGTEARDFSAAFENSVKKMSDKTIAGIARHNDSGANLVEKYEAMASNDTKSS